MNIPSDYIIVAIPLFLILLLILVGIFQWLWNSTMPWVLNVRKITYWQAIKLLLISAFLFRGSELLKIHFHS